MASSTSGFASAVLIPTRWRRSTSTICQVCRYLRFGLRDVVCQTRLPGSRQLRIEPVLGQWIVSTAPAAVSTSARKRL